MACIDYTPVHSHCPQLQEGCSWCIHVARLMSNYTPVQSCGITLLRLVICFRDWHHNRVVPIICKGRLCWCYQDLRRQTWHQRNFTLYTILSLSASARAGPFCGRAAGSKLLAACMRSSVSIPAFSSARAARSQKPGCSSSITACVVSSLSSNVTPGSSAKMLG